MGLYHLLYHSQASHSFDTPHLTALLHQARTYNRAHYITGLLLHTPDERFFQILEGEETVVRALYYDHIVHDPRHHRCRVLGAGACAERSFADWTMGCRLAQPADLRLLLGEPPTSLSLGLAPRPYPRPQLLTLLQDFVDQGPTTTGPPHPLDSRVGLS